MWGGGGGGNSGGEVFELMKWLPDVVDDDVHQPGAEGAALFRVVGLLVLHCRLLVDVGLLPAFLRGREMVARRFVREGDEPRLETRFVTIGRVHVAQLVG